MAKTPKDRPEYGATPVNVICMKWGVKYGPEYVNRLYRGVAQYLSRAHRFVCFTDDGGNSGDAVECVARTG